MRTILDALKESVNNLQYIKPEIIEVVENVVENKISIYDAGLKEQLSQTKTEIVSETKENVKRQLTEAKNEMTIQMNAVKESGFSLCSIIEKKLTETKNEVLDEMSNQRESTKLILSESEKRIAGIESHVQTHFTNLENQLKKTKQEIVAETEENFRLQITEAKNEVLAKINVSSELTKLSISKHEQLTSEMQSEIRIQIKEVEAILNTSGAFNEINNKVININAQEQTAKEQLAETSKKIIQQMGELGETQIAVVSNFTQKLTKTNGMVDEIKALLLNNENLIEKNTVKYASSVYRGQNRDLPITGVETETGYLPPPSNDRDGPLARDRVRTNFIAFQDIVTRGSIKSVSGIYGLFLFC
ncbi:hypothetical protein Zmor_017563 [Zophobas morio]|uniref:Uncharacterized protein n=1 Tax=Zophobas morio TaxID=2755281 RepID=A0AA38IA28_9CUCU|nr:hypothetical protein Zmor_017563 [Zophobas morio]